MSTSGLNYITNTNTLLEYNVCINVRKQAKISMFIKADWMLASARTRALMFVHSMIESST